MLNYQNNKYDNDETIKDTTKNYFISFINKIITYVGIIKNDVIIFIVNKITIHLVEIIFNIKK